jgi:hypothetical protein
MLEDVAVECSVKFTLARNKYRLHAGEVGIVPLRVLEAHWVNIVTTQLILDQA